MLEKIEGRKRRGQTKDEMVEWHHRLNGPGFGWTLGVGDEQGGRACCGPWGCKELDTTEWLNWTELNWIYIYIYKTVFDVRIPPVVFSQWIRAFLVWIFLWIINLRLFCSENRLHGNMNFQDQLFVLYFSGSISVASCILIETLLFVVYRLDP